MTSISAVPRQPPTRLARVEALLLPAALAAFALFAICLAINSQVDSDGTWFLYGRMLQRGVRLYTDLKLPQQPFFVLELNFWNAVVGPSWLASLIPTLLHLVLFTGGFYLIARQYAWPKWQGAIVGAGAAIIAIGWDFYRFDDYRVITDTVSLYVLVLFIAKADARAETRIAAPWVFVIGALCGLSFMTRANDGLMLFAMSAVAAAYLFRRRLLNAGLLVSGFLSVVSFVLLFTHDTLDAYIKYTLVDSHSLKGGTGHVMLAPFLLIGDVIQFILNIPVLFFSVAIFSVAAVPVFFQRMADLADPSRKGIILGIALPSIAVFDLFLIQYLSRMSYDCLANMVMPFGILAVAAAGAIAGLKLFGVGGTLDRRFVLFLIPLGALGAAAMSSGGKHPGIFTPVALFIAILPIACDLSGRARMIRVFALSLIVLVAAAIGIGKAERPLMWDYYQAAPMFSHREVVQHPIYGLMYVDKAANSFFSGICRDVQAAGGDRSVLSLPYSFANYYCGLDPWHANVQSFFDTSSADSIFRIISDLKAKPPMWIVYQRQLKFLRANEVFFNNGRRLPQRDLDEFIEHKLATGAWTTAARWTEQPGDDWALIRTSPAGVGSAGS